MKQGTNDLSVQMLEENITRLCQFCLLDGAENVTIDLFLTRQQEFSWGRLCQLYPGNELGKVGTLLKINAALEDIHNALD